MREAVHSRRNPIYAEAYAAMLRSYDFWKLYDHIEHSNMLGIFKGCIGTRIILRIRRSN